MVYIGTTNTLKRRIILSIAVSESNEYEGHFSCTYKLRKRYTATIGWNYLYTTTL